MACAAEKGMCMCVCVYVYVYVCVEFRGFMKQAHRHMLGRLAVDRGQAPQLPLVGTPEVRGDAVRLRSSQMYTPGVLSSGCSH